MNNNNKLSSALIIGFAILIAGLKFAYNNKLFEHIYNFERTYYKFEVKCEILENGSNLIDLRLTVPTEKEAQAIVSNWNLKNQEIYTSLLMKLL